MPRQGGQSGTGYRQSKPFSPNDKSSEGRGDERKYHACKPSGKKNIKHHITLRWSVSVPCCRYLHAYHDDDCDDGYKLQCF